MDQNKSGRLSANLTDIEVVYILGANDAGASHCQISALIGHSHSAITKVQGQYAQVQVPVVAWITVIP